MLLFGFALRLLVVLVPPPLRQIAFRMQMPLPAACFVASARALDGELKRTVVAKPLRCQGLFGGQLCPVLLGDCAVKHHLFLAELFRPD